MKSNWKQRLALLSAFTLIGATQASAALDEALTDSLADAQADGLLAVAAVGAMVIVVAVAAVAWRVGVKGIKRIGGAA